MTEPIEQKLLRLAESATPGPWRVNGSVSHIGTNRPYHPLVVANDVQLGGTLVAETLSIAPGAADAPFSAQSENDAVFIAALSPSTVIRLARVVEACRTRDWGNVADALDDLDTEAAK